VTEAFIIGFGGVLGALAALLAVVSVLGFGYFYVLFARAAMTVWRRRKRITSLCPRPMKGNQ